MPLPEFVREEYGKLRGELESHVEETLRLERYAVVGIAAVFAWLLKEIEHPGSMTIWAWYVPVMLPLVGGLRSFLLYQHIGLIAEYLSKLETALYADTNGNRNGEEKFGWEFFLGLRRNKYRGLLAAAIWFSLIGSTVFFAYCFAGKWPWA